MNTWHKSGTVEEREEQNNTTVEKEKIMYQHTKNLLWFMEPPKISQL